MVEIQICPVCQSAGFKTKYPSQFNFQHWEDAVPYFMSQRRKAVHGRIVSCENCGFVFTTPQFSKEEYLKIYANVPYFERTKISSVARNQRMDYVTRHFARSGRLLDIGCGDGSFLDLMAPDFDSEGIELGGCVGTRTHKGIPIHHGDITEIVHSRQTEWQGRFDVITAWDFFEHVSDLGIIGDLRHCIKPKGVLLCTLPDVSSRVARMSRGKWNCYLLEHLWYFSPQTLERFMKNKDFELVHTSGFPFPVDIQTLSLRLKQTFGIGLGRFPRLVPESFVINLPIGIMLCVFRPYMSM